MQNWTDALNKKSATNKYKWTEGEKKDCFFYVNHMLLPQHLEATFKWEPESVPTRV